jgi:hypothetical protein
VARPTSPEPPAPSGSHNLLAPSSAPSLPALFHAGSALGVALQSLLPPAQPHAVSSAVPLLAFKTPSGFSSVRESVTRPSGLDWSRARSSPGHFPFQGVHSLCDAPAFTGAPLTQLTRTDANGHSSLATGYLSQRAWLISLETADPPRVSGLLLPHARSSIARFWSRLLGRPGNVTIPCQPLFESVRRSTSAARHSTVGLTSMPSKNSSSPVKLFQGSFSC